MDTETALPTCYRHPDRETRLSCTSCGRPTCVDCVRSAAVGQKCLECAEPEGRSKVIHARDLRPTTGAPVTIAVLAVCVLAFLAGRFGGLGRELVIGGAQFNELVADGQWYRLITSAFLHGGFAHIFFNMWALYVFGPMLERRVGSWAFAALYLSSAVAGGAAFALLGPPDGAAVGASGAIFGLFGAWLGYAFRNRRTLAGRANLNQLLVLLGINAALPLLFPGLNIAWQAHVGGLIVGFVIALVWTLMGERRSSGIARTLVAVVAGLIALGAVIF